ncbi:hypothetical protein GXW74_20015 [Roseomonas eburnea]|uniref:AsmA-like C-terminal domain-containing protein n=1 Tax=Neoroseomonas eburnea TaxID=1346889 RepID=A0A9X9XGF3_9PROT|nr:hypothetical protein [Neoroseomonas eburnea]MBR0682789.1 hypothetical protein [Neoroseomonas eburnea]
MHAAARIGFRAAALATVAGLALAGAALAQTKPAPQGAPQQALPTTKPAPLGAPQQVRPGPRFAPAPPPAARAPAAPVTPPTAQAPGKPGQPPAAQAPAAPAPQAAVPQPVPANEPAAITRLRGLMGRDVRLSYGAAEALDPAGEQVRMTAVVMERPGKRATAEEVTLNGLREDGVAEALIRGFATEEAGTNVRVASIRIGGLTVPRNTAGGPPEPDQVRLEALRVEGVEATGTTTMRLATASVENWIAGQPSRMSLEGLEMGGLDAGLVDAFRLGRFNMSGMDFGTTLAAVMRQQTPPSLVGQAAIELDGLELTAGGRPVGGLAEMRIAADVTRTDGSGTGTVAFRGIRVEPLPVIADWLTRFGYQAIEGEITAETAFDGAAGRVEIRDLSIAGREVGALSFAVALDGLTQQQMQAGDFSSARLLSFGLRYADASLFGRFLAMQAAQTRTPEAQLREQYAAMAGGALTQPGVATLDPIRDAVQRFIRGQAQTVEIRANPPQPVTLQQVQGPPPNAAAAQRMFGITAEAR